MKLNAKQMQKLSAIKNSFYEDLKIEFLFHSNHLEGSTFTKKNLEKLLLDKQVQGVHLLSEGFMMNVCGCSMPRGNICGMTCFRAYR